MPDHRGYSLSDYRQREQERADLLPLRTACSLCQWEYLGTVAEGRERALGHRREAHPERLHYRKPATRHLSNFRQVNMDEEHWNEIESERRRRARLVGLELSD